MAAKRVYRDDMQCPRCGSNWLPKYGHFRGKQTYRCGQCLYHFTPGTDRPHRDQKVKDLALALYGEGLGLSAIGRVLGEKLGTVYAWVKKSLLGWGVAAGAGATGGHRRGWTVASASPGHRL